MNPPSGTLATVGAETPAQAVNVDFDPAEIAAKMESMTAGQVLEWTLENFHPQLYFACSFQKTSSVVIHLATEIESSARFFYVDTDLLFPETYATRDRFSEQFGVEFERYHGPSLAEQTEKHGDELWKRDPDACCQLRKVEPMRRALASVDCWVSGIRRSDSDSRAKAPKFAYDKRFGLWKVNPLADWSESDVWNYIREHNLPYNPLHDQGFPSIGCMPCTAKVEPGESSRSGRWAGTSKVECGIN